jgi:hypothetical protein
MIRDISFGASLLHGRLIVQPHCDFLELVLPVLAEDLSLAVRRQWYGFRTMELHSTVRSVPGSR